MATHVSKRCKLCKRKVVGRGFCKPHYQQWYKGILDEDGNKLRLLRTEKKCRYPDCEGNVHQYGLCNRHRRWVERGYIDMDLNQLKEFHPRMQDGYVKHKECKIAFCNRTDMKGQGMCHRHYRQYMRGLIDVNGKILDIDYYSKRVRDFSRITKCAVEYCKQQTEIKKLCRHHYHQYLNKIVDEDGNILKKLIKTKASVRKFKTIAKIGYIRHMDNYMYEKTTFLYYDDKTLVCESCGKTAPRKNQVARFCEDCRRPPSGRICKCGCGQEVLGNGKLGYITGHHSNHFGCRKKLDDYIRPDKISLIKARKHKGSKNDKGDFFFTVKVYKNRGYDHHLVLWEGHACCGYMAKLIALKKIHKKIDPLPRYSMEAFQLASL